MNNQLNTTEKYVDILTEEVGFWDAHAKRRSQHLEEYLQYQKYSGVDFTDLINSASQSLLLSLELRDEAIQELEERKELEERNARN